MISFTCDKCGKRFSVPDKFSGKKGKCKNCGTLVVVPTQQTVREAIIVDLPSSDAGEMVQTPRGVKAEDTIAISRSDLEPPPPPPKKASVRTRRLQAEWQQMQAAFSNFPLVRVAAVNGQPPELYQIEYNVTGLVRGASGEPILCLQHVAEIRLTRDYPRQSPVCRMLTPIFHPNIEPAMICVGDHWTAGERLVDLVLRIAEMIAYQAYNIKSPLDGEAAMWADLKKSRLPIDRRNLRPPEFD
jgi:ubiquitin-protein ligase/DNA-directed RNA polymerase subunit RPC12/RpoP